MPRSSSCQFHGAARSCSRRSSRCILVGPLAYDLLVQRRPIVITPALPWIARLPGRPDPVHDRRRRRLGAATVAEPFLVEGSAAVHPDHQHGPDPGPDPRDHLGPAPGRRRPRRAVAVQAGDVDLYQRVLRVRPDRGGHHRPDATGSSGWPGRSARRTVTPRSCSCSSRWPSSRPARSGRALLKLAALGCGALAAIAVALTFSRGAALAAGDDPRGDGRPALHPAGHVLVAVGLVAVVLIAVPAYGDASDQPGRSRGDASPTSRPSAGTDNSLLSRATENLAALNVFADHPIVGVGPEQFPRVLPGLRRRDRRSASARPIDRPTTCTSRPPPRPASSA